MDKVEFTFTWKRQLIQNSTLPEHWDDSLLQFIVFWTTHNQYCEMWMVTRVFNILKLPH